MGVHIHAYSNLALTEPHDYGPGCWEDAAEHILAFAYPGLERSLRGVPGHDVPKKLAAMGDREWIGGRCYTRTPDTEHRDVLDMPYGGYSRWRRVLAEASSGMTADDLWAQAEMLDPDAVPFFEIICFADNEGTIGPLAAADLVEDFTDEARERFAAAIPAGEGAWGCRHFLEAWDGWRAGVALAAKSGLIEYR